MEAFLIAVIVVVVVFAAMGLYFHSAPVNTSGVIEPVSVIQDGTKETQYTLPIPKSENQPDGMTFSYAGWVRIDNFAHKFGTQKIIFSKGSDDAMVTCPAFIIDANSNTFIVKIDTFGTQEVVPVQNIPAKKWIHFAIAIDQNAVNIYINGTLHTHHTLNQLPKQNSDPVYVSPKGGFVGKFGLLQYYPYMLTPDSVVTLAATSPQPDTTDKGIGIMPPYFAPSWWVSQD